MVDGGVRNGRTECDLADVGVDEIDRRRKRASGLGGLWSFWCDVGSCVVGGDMGCASVVAGRIARSEELSGCLICRGVIASGGDSVRSNRLALPVRSRQIRPSTQEQPYGRGATRIRRASRLSRILVAATARAIMPQRRSRVSVNSVVRLVDLRQRADNRRRSAPVIDRHPPSRRCRSRGARPIGAAGRCHARGPRRSTRRSASRAARSHRTAYSPETPPTSTAAALQ